MPFPRILAAFAALLLLAGCAGGPGGGGFGFQSFTLVQPRAHSVARGSMVVTPTVPWNRIPRGPYDISREENWTLNGPLLDSLSFVGGLGSGSAIVRQRRRDERQVPVFRPDMTPQEIASMIETFYRIRAGSVRFDMTELKPRTFLGHPGFQLDFRHLGGNEVERQGRVVGAVIGERLYLALFDGARMHYFPAGLPEFERIVETARLPG
jgi:hypothetical protein